MSGHVIVTSRLSDWSGSVEPFELELLSEEAAVEFLLERTKDRRVNDPSDGDKGARTGESVGRARAGAGAGRRRSVNVNRPPHCGNACIRAPVALIGIGLASYFV